MLDSLWCSSVIDLKEAAPLLDLGSGAGLPGIPLKICFPEASLSLLESQQKRCLFLKEAISRLELEDCEVLNGRAEDLAHERNYREKFGCVTSRALAQMSTLAELALPFVAQDGHLVALKGSAAEEEIVKASYALDLMGGVVERVITYHFPGEKGRNVVSVKKIKPTPENYPRRPGIPTKRPLRE
jgi:16S rRNA (guanine527-N7)-methyltransferase